MISRAASAIEAAPNFKAQGAIAELAERDFNVGDSIHERGLLSAASEGKAALDALANLAVGSGKPPLPLRKAASLPAGLDSASSGMRLAPFKSALFSAPPYKGAIPEALVLERRPRKLTQGSSSFRYASSSSGSSPRSSASGSLPSSPDSSPSRKLLGKYRLSNYRAYNVPSRGYSPPRSLSRTSSTDSGGPADFDEYYKLQNPEVPQPSKPISRSNSDASDSSTDSGGPGGFDNFYKVEHSNLLQASERRSRSKPGTSELKLFY